MNTGIQDAIDLGWKLALVLKGRASHALLETYGQDRLPVIKGVLTKTEGLTGVIGSENPLVRTAFNHVAPWVVGTDFIQDKSTTRMSQIGLNYRDSPLSETHAHGGDLKAGDRVPDFGVVVLPTPGKAGDGERHARLYEMFDSCKFTLLLTNIADRDALHAKVGTTIGPWLDLIHGMQVAPGGDAADADHFAKTFGKSASLMLVRPDSYVGFVGDEGNVEKLAAYLKKWMTADDAPVAGGDSGGEHYEKPQHH